MLLTFKFNTVKVILFLIYLVKIAKLFYAVPLFTAVIAAPVFAGSNYKLKYDKFQDKKVATYDLSLGIECRLDQTSKSTLNACDFLTVSNDAKTPTVMLTSTANGWDIMTYKSASPYSNQQAPAIITYKNGIKKKTNLPAIFNGDVISGRLVMETIIVRLGGIKQELLSIDNIELKYGSNEYYIKLDDALTRKALNYQE
jgi:hypothetical protein